MWAPVPPAVPSGNVQQWQQRWQPAVPNLQDHLWSEDWQPTTRQDGVSRYPPLTARAPRLQNYPDYLQHPPWHSGTHLALSESLTSTNVANLMLWVLQSPDPKYTYTYLLIFTIMNKTAVWK